VVGRWSAAANFSSVELLPNSTPFQIVAEQTARLETEKANFANVTIEKLGEVEFDHAFELLRAAPKEALMAWTKRLETLPVSPRQTAAITVFFKTLSEIDTKTAVDLALSIERPEKRWIAIGAVDSAAPLTNLPEIARMYLAINETNAPLVGDLIGRWSAIDPEATARFLAHYPGKVANDEIATFLSNWAAQDPAAARQWLAETDASRRAPRVYADFYAGWMLKDRATALQDLAARSDDKTMKKAIKLASENLFTDSPDTARAFILSLSNDTAQKAAVGQVTLHITGVFLGSGDYLHLEPDAVAKWLLTLPENLWEKVIGSVLERWAYTDSTALNTWLNQITPQMKDRLLTEQCRAFNWNAPTDGLKAGLQIHDPALRETTFRVMFKEMAQDSREEILQKAELSAEEVAELQRILKHL